MTWNSESEVMIVAAEMSAILTFTRFRKNFGEGGLFKWKLLVSRNFRPRELYKIVKRQEIRSRNPCSALKIGFIIDPHRAIQGFKPLSFAPLVEAELSRALLLLIRTLRAYIDGRDGGAKA